MATKALIAASTKPMVLSILSYGENYGYNIIQEVERMSGGELQWTDAMLYPVLKRMEKEKLISSRWVKTESGRKRKYYKITDTGRAKLTEEKTQWLNVNTIFESLWGNQDRLSLTEIQIPIQ
ncbi:Transcriptional regulator PadR-like family protein [Robiginitalea myxolifaciens]|uniref:Transcriptional regulator PadR-like family protein n=1 Tax=Robiginitalea myxolifaciens TaxID=400055 RepID=A0A1I6HB28_9FLAO|nr:helix-turn-helix transcriptional regulator [Robiginitalea myxolifaciens]SFR51477.1 Transcriptional regulator PadR-like family protein [Robiginitalea myxolifaciens]